MNLLSKPYIDLHDLMLLNGFLNMSSFLMLFSSFSIICSYLIWLFFFCFDKDSHSFLGPKPLDSPSESKLQSYVILNTFPRKSVFPTESVRVGLANFTRQVMFPEFYSCTYFKKLPGRYLFLSCSTRCSDFDRKSVSARFIYYIRINTWINIWSFDKERWSVLYFPS